MKRPVNEWSGGPMMRKETQSDGFTRGPRERKVSKFGIHEDELWCPIRKDSQKVLDPSLKGSLVDYELIWGCGLKEALTVVEKRLGKRRNGSPICSTQALGVTGPIPGHPRFREPR